MARVAIIGTGYVGLTTGACLAHLGHDVVCADVVESKVALLSQGRIPIVEAGLEDLVGEGLAAGRLRFVLGAAGALPGAEFVFLCLPTPRGADGHADLGPVLGAAGEIGPSLEPNAVVVNKSTVPVGSARRVARAVGRVDVAVVSNPEFLREGRAVADFLGPDRVVIGGDPLAVDRVAALYTPLGAPLVLTDAASAEMIKYAANAFLATKLSFVNAVANLCERLGSDMADVALGLGYDRRIGHDFLTPGPGWGGSCFPKDTRALVEMAGAAGYDFDLLRSAIAANELQHQHVADKVARMAGGSLLGVTVGVWGLTFKAGTDDLRDSPALAVIERLRRAGAEVRAYDPAVAGPLEGVRLTADPYGAAFGADVLVVLTEWPEFAEADFTKVRELMAAPRVVDARNLLNPVALAGLGFAYDAIGRPGSPLPASGEAPLPLEIDLTGDRVVAA